MKGFKCRKEMRLPFSTPLIEARSSPAKTDGRQPNPCFKNNAATREESAMLAPMERSMPAAATTKVMPIDRMMPTEA